MKISLTHRKRKFLIPTFHARGNVSVEFKRWSEFFQTYYQRLFFKQRSYSGKVTAVGSLKDRQNRTGFNFSSHCDVRLKMIRTAAIPGVCLVEVSG